MRYVFFGSPEFAATVLRELLEKNMIPQAIVCNPDRPQGRKKAITPPVVKSLISSYASQIEIFQPEHPEAIADKLRAMHPDLFIIAAYAKIVRKEILAIPRLGTIGVHPSLLPKYRGASPIQSVILAGESETGTTLFLVDEKVDHGSIIAATKETIEPTDTYEILEKKLAQSGGKLLAETLSAFSSGTTQPQVQDESRATFTKKFITEDGFVAPELLLQAEQEGGHAAFEIDRMIRALNPEPGVYTIRDEKRVKLLAATIENGKLKLHTIQIEGKKPHML